MVLILLSPFLIIKICTPQKCLTFGGHIISLSVTVSFFVGFILCMRPSLSETMVFLSEMQKAGRSLPRTARWSFRSKTVNYDLPSPQLFAGHFDVRLSRLQPAESKRPFLPHFGGGALLFGDVSPSSQRAVIFFPRPSVVILKYVGLFLSHRPHRKILSFSTVTVSMNSVSTSLSAFPFSFTVNLPSRSRT